MMTPSRRLLILLAATATTALYGADAAANWQEHCAKCHGQAGKGESKMGRKLGIGDLSDAKVQAEFTDETAFKTIKSGRVDDTGKVRMKPTEGLSDEEITALVAYVRSLKQ